MGATAVRALLGGGATISSLRGALQQSPLAGPTVVTIHLSAVVRIQDPDERHAERDALAGDLAMAAREAGVA